MRLIPASALIAAAFFLTAPDAGAGGLDTHRLFEQRCGGCHGHAGDLSRERLSVTGGVLLGRDSGREIRTYLSDHYGSLGAGDIASLIEAFTLQIRMNGLFRDRCLICHGRAAEMARLRLIMSGGRVVGRYTGNDIEDFLLGHGRLNADEADLIVEMLRWQLAD